MMLLPPAGQTRKGVSVLSAILPYKTFQACRNVLVFMVAMQTDLITQFNDLWCLMINSFNIIIAAVNPRYYPKFTGLTV